MLFTFFIWIVCFIINIGAIFWQSHNFLTITQTKTHTFHLCSSKLSAWLLDFLFKIFTQLPLVSKLFYVLHCFMQFQFLDNGWCDYRYVNVLKKISVIFSFIFVQLVRWWSIQITEQLEKQSTSWNAQESYYICIILTNFF